jgi:hypothetical protein
MKVIHAENSLDLGEESRQEPEISVVFPLLVEKRNFVDDYYP